MGGAIRIGISGWIYPSWRGRFYPRACRKSASSPSPRRGSPRSRSTARSTPCSARRLRALARADAGGLRLRAEGPALHHARTEAEGRARPAPANFFASGVLRLGDELGPILWQFPRAAALRRERFADFLELLPRDTAGALGSRATTTRSSGRAWLAIDRNRPLRHAFEVRHESFRDRSSRCCAGTTRRWSSRTPRDWPRRGRHRGPRLRPPARLEGALRQRLQRPRN